MSLIQIDWRPDARELRKFGITMLVFCALAAGIFYWRDLPRFSLGLLILGGVSFVLGISGTRAALVVYWPWMAIALGLGLVVTPVVFGILYYGLITPLGMIMRLVGHDKLQLRCRGRDSHWREVPPPPDKSRYERQF